MARIPHARNDNVTVSFATSSYWQLHYHVSTLVSIQDINKKLNELDLALSQSAKSCALHMHPIRTWGYDYLVGGIVTSWVAEPQHVLIEALQLALSALNLVEGFTYLKEMIDTHMDVSRTSSSRVATQVCQLTRWLSFPPAHES